MGLLCNSSFDQKNDLEIHHSKIKCRKLTKFDPTVKKYSNFLNCTFFLCRVFVEVSLGTTAAGVVPTTLIFFNLHTAVNIVNTDRFQQRNSYFSYTISIFRLFNRIREINSTFSTKIFISKNYVILHSTWTFDGSTATYPKNRTNTCRYYRKIFVIRRACTHNYSGHLRTIYDI